MTNAYMQFCTRCRASKAWKANKYNTLPVPEQGVLLGRMYRSLQQPYRAAGRNTEVRLREKALAKTSELKELGFSKGYIGAFYDTLEPYIVLVLHTQLLSEEQDYRMEFGRTQNGLYVANVHPEIFDFMKSNPKFRSNFKFYENKSIYRVATKFNESDFVAFGG